MSFAFWDSITIQNNSLWFAHQSQTKSWFRYLSDNIEGWSSIEMGSNKTRFTTLLLSDYKDQRNSVHTKMFARKAVEIAEQVDIWIFVVIKKPFKSKNTHNSNPCLDSFCFIIAFQSSMIDFTSHFFSSLRCIALPYYYHFFFFHYYHYHY